MANDEHVAILKKGVDAWNAWRHEKIIGPASPGTVRRVYIPHIGADLSGADLYEANLSGADLSGADLGGANLRGADLRGAKLNVANLSGADLRGACLHGARLFGADLSGADLRGAKLPGASLYGARLLDTDLTGADLTGCRIHGVSVWNVKLERTKQQDLVITKEDEPTVTVDNIEVAQFIYLMLNNQKVREVIDTITSKAVLILGRFTDERKAVLDALREELRKRDYLGAPQRGDPNYCRAGEHRPCWR